MKTDWGKLKNIKYFIKYYSFDCLVLAFVFIYLFLSIFIFSNLASASLDSSETFSEKREGIEEAILFPERIKIPKIGLDEAVYNPELSSDFIFERYLEKGIVRHSDSGSLGEGNMLFLGHSSRLKIVRNEAFKVFNNLDKLKFGDEIIVFNSGEPFVYRVKSVSKVDADETLVDFESEKPTLTLSTCNVLGQKEERIVVIAEIDQ